MRLSTLAFVLSAALLAACNSTPTLPLPPPVVTVSTPDVRGLALVEGRVKPRAFVFVFNERIESGVIMRSDLEGRFSVEIEAATADVLTVWQEAEGEPGERKQTVIPAPR